MSRTYACALALILALAGTLSVVSDNRLVVLLIVDGLDKSYLDSLNTPNFDRVYESGVSAVFLESVLPAKSIPTQYSLLTGLLPHNHGIISDQLYDREAGGLIDRDSAWWKGEPIWETASKQGLRVAVYNYLAQSTLQGVIEYDPKVSDSEVADLVTNWVQKPFFIRPQFIAASLSRVKMSANLYGPLSKQAQHSVLDTDYYIGMIWDAVRKQGGHLVVVSGHGGQVEDDSAFSADPNLLWTASPSTLGTSTLENGLGNLFLVAGPKVRQNRLLHSFHSIHVYPFVCHLLGIEPAKNDGNFWYVADALSEE